MKPGKLKVNETFTRAKRCKNALEVHCHSRAQTSTLCHIRKLRVLVCLPLHTLHLALDMFASENISA